MACLWFYPGFVATRATLAIAKAMSGEKMQTPAITVNTARKTVSVSVQLSLPMVSNRDRSPSSLARGMTVAIMGAGVRHEAGGALAASAATVHICRHSGEARKGQKAKRGDKHFHDLTS